MRKLLRRIRETYLTFGAKGIWRRFSYLHRKRVGSLHRLPFHDKPAPPLAIDRVFTSTAVQAGPELRALCESLLAGQLDFFSGCRHQVSYPPDWLLHPITGKRYSSQRLWADFKDLEEGIDIKFLWEMSRFGFLGPLARIFVATGEGRYSEAAMHAMRDWIEKNPAGYGPNWMCAQEVALRCIAWIQYFRVTGLAPPPAVVRNLYQSGQRILQTYEYSLSQRNNHALSEAAALLSLAVSFDREGAAADFWVVGRKMLLEVCETHFGKSGEYIQHSFIYHRLVLELLLWIDVFVSPKVNDEALWRVVRRTMEKSVRFLLGFLDSETGYLPNFGANDGTRLFHYYDGEYRDFRPILQAVACKLWAQRLFQNRDVDTLAAWFGLSFRGSETIALESSDLSKDGYYTFRSPHNFVMIRAPSHWRSRPGQADNLHVDLTFDGVNVAFDPGTYLYNGDGLWKNGLANSTAHNCLTVNHLPMLTKGPRFLWFDWPICLLQQTERNQRLTFWDFKQVVPALSGLSFVHFRAVVCSQSAVVIIDDFAAKVSIDVNVGWNLAYEPKRSADDHWVLYGPERQGIALHLYSASDVSSRCHNFPAKDDAVEGWNSTTYGAKTRMHRFAIEARATAGRIVTVFSKHPVNIDLSSGVLLTSEDLRFELSSRNSHGEVTFRAGRVEDGKTSH